MPSSQNGENQLPEEQISRLLPALSVVAEHISNGSKLDRQELAEIVLGVGVTGEEWAFGELQLWVKILGKACDNPSIIVRTAVIAELQDRGVPEFPAVLAYESVKPKPFSVDPQEVDFGCLKHGEGDNKTLTVRGGDVDKVFWNNHRLKVIRQKMKDGTTSIKVQLSGNAGGESLQDEIALRGPKGELIVPVKARWEKAPEEPPRLSFCPVCKISKKSLFWNYINKKYECLNLQCKATGTSLDKLVSPYRR